ncbi:MAG: tetratricopeptide repeat protein [Sphingomonadaceae bacterium]|nr:tetratricopeptide repeat protein [Sphingomonadaceae bacterium]
MQDFEPSGELAALLAFVERDGSNTVLLAETIERSYEESALELTATLIDRYRTLAPLPPPLTNLAGLVALRSGDAEGAAAQFDELIGMGQDDSGLRFNRAWCYALEGDYEAALGLLTEEAALTHAQAATLRIEAFHHLGTLDEALRAGAIYVERFPDHAALFGALAQVALDAERAELAEAYAARAGETVQGISARGMLLLSKDRGAEALVEFDKALAARPDDARALLGRGVGLLAQGDTEDALAAIQRGAECFGTHVGSWVAAGWLNLINRNFSKSRDCFDRAMAIDGSFAESHGGLAVLDLLDGDATAAERGAERALRLDRASFGGALARILILQARGNAEQANELLTAALAAPAGPGGKSIGDVLGVMALGGISFSSR